MPIPYLVNPQSDTTPPTYVHQTVRRAISFNRRTDFWGDDTSLQQRPRPMAAERRRRTLIQANGHRTAASSEASSHTFITAPAGFETTETLWNKALDSIWKAADTEEKEAKKKEDGDEEPMDADAALDSGQDKGPADGEDKAGGSSTVS